MLRHKRTTGRGAGGGGVRARSAFARARAESSRRAPQEQRPGDLRGWVPAAGLSGCAGLGPDRVWVKFENGYTIGLVCRLLSMLIGTMYYRRGGTAWCFWARQASGNPRADAGSTSIQTGPRSHVDRFCDSVAIVVLTPALAIVSRLHPDTYPPRHSRVFGSDSVRTGSSSCHPSPEAAHGFGVRSDQNGGRRRVTSPHAGARSLTASAPKNSSASKRLCARQRS